MPFKAMQRETLLYVDMCVHVCYMCVYCVNACMYAMCVCKMFKCWMIDAFLCLQIFVSFTHCACPNHKYRNKFKHIHRPRMALSGYFVAGSNA